MSSDSVKHVRFVQVAVSGVNNTQTTESDYVFAALDDKGRIWEKLVGHEWYLLESPEEPS